MGRPPGEAGKGRCMILHVVNDQHQMKADAAWGKTRGVMRRLTSAVAGHNTQDWSSLTVRAGFQSPFKLANRGAVVPALYSHRLDSSSPSRRPAPWFLPRGVGHYSGELRDTARRRSFIHRANGSTRGAKSIPHQPQVHIAGRVLTHHYVLLLCSPSSDGQRTIGKELTNGTKSLPPDGKAYD
jgi:hypothetical protein